MQKVLFLTAWYPHRYDQMAGLFVRKHALAAAENHNIAVLYFHPDEHVPTLEIVENTTRITEIIIYYNPSLQIWTILQAGWKYIEKHWGRPDLVHCNVLSKSTLLAYWAKRKYNIPYIITEHWSGYLPENGQFAQLPFIKKWLLRKVAQHAALLLPVSQCLENAMLKNGIKNAHIERIHNVVEDFFYEERNAAREASNCEKRAFCFLAVNCFDERSKNNKGLLRAFRESVKQKQNITLTIVGTGVTFNEILQYAQDLQFPEGTLRFLGELPPEQVAAEMREADCMVMFSNYENAPVVISESLATGLPVLASRVGGIPEMIEHGKTGYLVEVGNETALTNAMLCIANQELTFSKEVCKKAADKYRFQVVADHLKEIYSRFL